MAFKQLVRDIISSMHKDADPFLSVVEIDGIRFSHDLLSMLAEGNPDYIYSIRRDGEKMVIARRRG